MKMSNRSLLSETIALFSKVAFATIAVIGTSTVSRAQFVPESAIAVIDNFAIGWDIKIEGNPGGGGGEGGTPGGLGSGGVGVLDAVHYAYHCSYTPSMGYNNPAQVDWDITHYYPTFGPLYTWHTYFSGSAWSHSEQNWTEAPMNSGTYVTVMTPSQPSPRAWRKYIFTLDVGYYVDGNGGPSGQGLPSGSTWHSVKESVSIRQKNY
jgi:hypothetical protein